MRIIRNNAVFSGIAGLFIASMSTHAADIVHLNNGDKITGIIQEMGAEKILIDTDYVEGIEISWDDISNLETDDEVTIMKSDNTRLKGKIDSFNSGNLTLGGSPVAINDISKISPVPEGTYVGEGAFHVGGFLSTGNTDKGSLHVDTEYVLRNEVNRFTIGGTYDLAHDRITPDPDAAEDDIDIHDTKETANNLRVFGKYDRFLDKNWYVYANADFTKDRFQALDYRISGGAGLGYQFWDESDKFLSFEAGPGYTYEVYNGEDNIDPTEALNADGSINPGFLQTGTDEYSREDDERSYVNARWALDFHHWFLDESLQFYHNHEGIISVEKFSDVLIRTHTGIKVPIFKGFDVIAQFDYDWKNIPASGKDREDFRYILGVGYGW